MEYQRFDPSGCGFPKPKVSPLPTFSRKSLGTSSNQYRVLGDGAGTDYFTRGRYALTAAFAHAGVGPAGSLLAPAYHCRTMLDPAIRLNAEIGLYPLHADLTPDIDQLEKILASCKAPAKALLLPHYFGFAQPLEVLVDFCDRHGLALIEDCSHALLVKTARSGTALGRTGRFGVASPYKFVAAEDGGMMWSNSALPLATNNQRKPALTAEIKALLRSFRQAVRAPNVPRIDALSAELDAWEERSDSVGADTQVSEFASSAQYQNTDEDLRSLRWSRWITRHSDLDRLASNRRTNYQRWVRSVEALPGCQALFPELPDSCVPYMFPLHIDQPNPHFYAMKHLGVPVWRWDDMALSSCDTASEYRLSLLHLPCHQELSEDQMDWMIAAVIQVLKRPNGEKR